MSGPEPASSSEPSPPASWPGAHGGRSPGESVVVDASAVVDLLAGTELAFPAGARLRGTALHAPAHCEAEVLSALGRLQRADELSADQVEAALGALSAIPVTRHPVAGLLAGAWARRGQLRLLDALYIELAAQLEVLVVTTDQRMARASEHAQAVVTTGAG